MRRLFAGLAAVGLITVSTAMNAGAVIYSETNKGIDIVYGEFTGYRFTGPDAPVSDIDSAEIKAVKFYIKVEEPVGDISGTIVELAYNSGSTGWVSKQHDLEDGLIVEIEVEGGVVTGDFFDAGLTTWNEGVSGTFSLEALDANDDILGIPVYEGNTAVQETEPLNQTESVLQASEPPTTTTMPETSEVMNEVNQATQPRTVSTKSPMDEQEERAANPPTSTANAVRTGSTNIITASVMCLLSAFAIVSMRKKKDK